MTRSKHTFTYDATTTTATANTVNESAFVRSIAVVVPNFTNAITVTLSIKDKDGYEVISKAAIAKNATTVFLKEEVPVYYDSTLTITLSGAAGGTGGTVAVVLYHDTRD